MESLIDINRFLLLILLSRYSELCSFVNRYHSSNACSFMKWYYKITLLFVLRPFYELVYEVNKYVKGDILWIVHFKTLLENHCGMPLVFFLFFFINLRVFWRLQRDRRFAWLRPWRCRTVWPQLRQPRWVRAHTHTHTHTHWYIILFTTLQHKSIWHIEHTLPHTSATLQYSTPWERKTSWGHSPLSTFVFWPDHLATVKVSPLLSAGWNQTVVMVFMILLMDSSIFIVCHAMVIVVN